MGNSLASLGYFCVGTLFGLAAMALVFAVARRRRALDLALGNAYGPLHALLDENEAARRRVAETEERLMSTYASESSPYSPEQKKAAAEAFLALEAAMLARVINPNRERMRAVVTEWGHLLRDDDYLALSAELARATTARVFAEMDLPKELRDERPAADREADVLEQVRGTYLELSRRRRAGFLSALAQGVKHIFSGE